MSIPSPLLQYHFHVILILWHSPFKALHTYGEIPAYTVLQHCSLNFALGFENLAFYTSCL